jgi:oligopeptide/dipeptide ABC transporter ATP-binding protein
MPELAEPIVCVRDLSKHFTVRARRGGYKTLRAVDGVSFTLERAKTLAIVGESGSGKSTLARALLRLVEPTSGQITLEGRDLLGLSPRDMRATRRHVQMIFQDPYASLHPRRSVAESISEGWKVHKGIVEPKDFDARIAELLVQVGLSPAYAAAYPSRLSGGERQRVAIARALAMRPEVLILDEPVSALDVSIQAQVITLLMRLQQELQMAYIFISHDLPLVRLVADRVAVMYLGRFIEEGPAEAIYAHATHPYTQALLRSVPSHDTGAGVPEAVAAPDAGSALNLPSGCRFRPRCWKAQDICARIEPTIDTARAGDHGSACHFATEAPLN